jgi:DNA-binding transcriptional ArsR family regulator
MVIINMGNKRVFKALSSETRVQILKILSKEQLHISGLAKKIGISVPVMSRHVEILEEVGLVKKRVLGNLHLLTVDFSIVEQAWNEISDHTDLEIFKDETLFDALKQLPEVSFSKYKDKQFISSINGEKGYYIYEVNGKPPDVSIDEFTPKKDVLISLKKIVPIEKKKISVKVRKKKK